jgi:hypothetical protein
VLRGAYTDNLVSKSTGELAEKFLLVHTVFKRLATVDKDHRNLIVILAAQTRIRVDIYFAPIEAAAAMEFDKALLNDFAETAALAGVDDDFPMLHTHGSLAGQNRVSKPLEGVKFRHGTTATAS